MWQHMYVVMGPIITTLLKIIKQSTSERIFDRIMAMSSVWVFLAHPVGVQAENFRCRETVNAILCSGQSKRRSEGSHSHAVY